ncbi:MAG: DUF1349 domain-containing protein [Erysipelotrichaceae bacterium]|nr:DUF1349 domain-containing protein [Erysipelotrichaceae bacterium]
MGKVDISKMEWVNKPTNAIVAKNKVIIETDPYTNMWSETYYHVSQNNPHALVLPIEQDFTFKVRVDFKFNTKYDQAGMVIYANDDNWFKVGIEYKNKLISYIFTTITYHGYSDLSTHETSSDLRYMYFRVSKQQEDFKVEGSFDGKHFKQMRVFHLKNRTGKFKVGIYACSPRNSSFDVTFSEMEMSDSVWKEHEWEDEK